MAKKKDPYWKNSSGKTRVMMHTHPSDVPNELDLHGCRVEEGLEILDDYLDKAYCYGLSPIRIVHGHGTGKLRKAVREHLRRHPQVKSFKPGDIFSGGEGCTVVYLKTTPLIN